MVGWQEAHPAHENRVPLTQRLFSRKGGPEAKPADPGSPGKMAINS